MISFKFLVGSNPATEEESDLSFFDSVTLALEMFLSQARKADMSVGGLKGEEGKTVELEKLMLSYIEPDGEERSSQRGRLGAEQPRKLQSPSK